MESYQRVSNGSYTSVIVPVGVFGTYELDTGLKEQSRETLDRFSRAKTYGLDIPAGTKAEVIKFRRYDQCKIGEVEGRFLRQEKITGRVVYIGEGARRGGDYTWWAGFPHIPGPNLI